MFKMEIGFKPQPQNFTYIWFTIHLVAINAKTDEEKKNFSNYMTLLSKNLPCLKCRKHLEQHIAKDPPEKYFDKEQGCFYWSWLLHNKVNKFLKKPEPSYDQALIFFKDLDKFGCDVADCMEEEKKKILGVDSTRSSTAGGTKSKVSQKNFHRRVY